MDIAKAIQERDRLKIELGVLEGKRAEALTQLKAQFGTEDVTTLATIRANKANELTAALPKKAAIEQRLDVLFAGVHNGRY